MVGESKQNVFLIQIDASSFAEFEISEFEILRVDCSFVLSVLSVCPFVCLWHNNLTIGFNILSFLIIHCILKSVHVPIILK